VRDIKEQGDCKVVQDIGDIRFNWRGHETLVEVIVIGFHQNDQIPQKSQRLRV